MFKKFLNGLIRGMRKQLAEDDQMDTLSFLSHMNSLRTRYIAGLIDLDDDISGVDYYLAILRLELRVAHRFRRLRKDRDEATIRDIDDSHYALTRETGPDMSVDDSVPYDKAI